jgi:hypothetical protein
VPSRESGEAGEGQTRAAIAIVIAGLDPAIHPVRKKVLTKKMDPRVTKELRQHEVPLTRPSLRSGPPSPRSASLRGARVHSMRGAIYALHRIRDTR